MVEAESKYVEEEVVMSRKTRSNISVIIAKAMAISVMNDVIDRKAE